jgi:Heparinase II/III-like protein
MNALGLRNNGASRLPRRRFTPVFHFVSLLASLLASIFISNAFCQAFPALPDGMFNKLAPNHPRLILTETRLDELRTEEKKGQAFTEGMQYLRSKGQQILSQPTEAYVQGQLLETSRSILDRVFTLAFLARFDKDRRWSDRALKEMQAAAAYPNWNPENFLAVAEMLAAFAIGYDWLYDYCTETQRAAIRKAIHDKGFKPAIAQFEEEKFWIRTSINWNPVCNSGISLAALAVGKEDSVAQSLLHRALLSLQQSGALSAYGPDGAYSEGINYWGYSTQYLTLLFSGLATSLGNDFGFSKKPGMAETGLFPIYCEGTSRRMFNFSDSKDARIYPFWMAGLAMAYQNPMYAWYSQNHFGSHVLDFLWFDANADRSDLSALPLSRRFRGTELAIFRGSWTDSNASYLAFKAGGLTNEHTHLDAGSFVFDALGIRWAMDLGPDEYDLPGYFIDFQDSSRRYEYYRIRAQGQNTLTLKPGMGPDQERSAISGLVEYDPNQMRALADLTPAYASVASQVMRGITLVEGKSALIQDEIRLQDPGDIWWRMHTEAAVTIAADGQMALLESQGKQLWVKLVRAPAGARFKSQPALPIPGTPRPSGQNPNPSITVLAIEIKQSASASIAIWMVPLAPGESAPLKAPPLDTLTLAGWKPATWIQTEWKPFESEFSRRSRAGLKALHPGTGQVPGLYRDALGKSIPVLNVSKPGHFQSIWIP